MNQNQPTNDAHARKKIELFLLAEKLEEARLVKICDTSEDKSTGFKLGLSIKLTTCYSRQELLEQIIATL